MIYHLCIYNNTIENQHTYINVYASDQSESLLALELKERIEWLKSYLRKFCQQF